MTFQNNKAHTHGHMTWTLGSPGNNKWPLQNVSWEVNNIALYLTVNLELKSMIQKRFHTFFNKLQHKQKKGNFCTRLLKKNNQNIFYWNKILSFLLNKNIN